MAVHVIEVSQDPDDPDAELSNEGVRTDIGDKGWFWTHVSSTHGQASNEVHGPFPTEEAAVADAARTLGGSIQS